MIKLNKTIEQILNNFAEQERGNRLSDFAMLALKQILLNEIKIYKPENGKDDKKEAKK